MGLCVAVILLESPVYSSLVMEHWIKDWSWIFIRDACYTFDMSFSHLEM